jgi:Predicted integral membrane protein (DUF2270)
MYGPLLRLEGVRVDNGWNEALALNYERLHFHISFWEAMERRLRRNYSFLFVIQAFQLRSQNMHSPDADQVARPAVGAGVDRSGSGRGRASRRVSLPRRADRTGAPHLKRAARSRACGTACAPPVRAGHHERCQMMIVRLSAQRTFEAFALSQLNSFIVQALNRSESGQFLIGP